MDCLPACRSSDDWLLAVAMATASPAKILWSLTPQQADVWLCCWWCRLAAVAAADDDAVAFTRCSMFLEGVVTEEEEEVDEDEAERNELATPLASDAAVALRLAFPLMICVHRSVWLMRRCPLLLGMAFTYWWCWCWLLDAAAAV